MSHLSALISFWSWNLNICCLSLQCSDVLQRVSLLMLAIKAQNCMFPIPLGKNTNLDGSKQNRTEPCNDSSIFTRSSNSVLMHKSKWMHQKLLFISNSSSQINLESWPDLKNILKEFVFIKCHHYWTWQAAVEMCRGVGVVSNDAWQGAVFVWFSPSMSPSESGRLKARASPPHSPNSPLWYV